MRRSPVRFCSTRPTSRTRTAWCQARWNASSVRSPGRATTSARSRNCRKTNLWGQTPAVGLRGAGAAVPALVGELVRRAEELVGQPLAGLRTGERVEQDPERDAGQQQCRVARAVLLLALDTVGCLAQLLDCVLQPLLDVLVGRHARGERDRAAAAQ